MERRSDEDPRDALPIEVQDLSVEHIASVLGIPVGTVKSRLHRGRVALGRALGGETTDNDPGPNPPRANARVEPEPPRAPSNPAKP